MEEGFKQLYLQHFEALCRFADFYCSDSHLAKDAVQQVFLKLWESQKDISSLENPRAYLYTATKNQILNDQRKAKVLLTSEKEDQPVPHKAEEDLQGKDLQKRLTYWVDKLPEKRQYIFRLSREENKTYKEIADLLEIAPKTVENQIGKALKFLKDKIY